MIKLIHIILSMLLCVCCLAKASTNIDVIIQGKTSSPKIFFKEITTAGKKIFNNPQKEFNFILFASLLGFPDFKGVDESKPVNFALIKSGDKKQFLLFIYAKKDSFLAKQILANVKSKYEKSCVIASLFGVKKASEIVSYTPNCTPCKNLFEIEGKPADIVNFLQIQPPDIFKNVLKETEKVNLQCNIQDTSALLQITLYAKKQSDIKTFYEQIKKNAEDLKIKASLNSSENKCVIFANFELMQFGKIATNMLDKHLIEESK